MCDNEFSSNKNGSGGTNRKVCFECMPEGLSKSERNKHKTQLYYVKMNNEKIAQGCSQCGYNKCAQALDWHHLNKDEKEIDPANAIKRSWDLYKKETSKCILVCANCHREIHNLN